MLTLALALTLTLTFASLSLCVFHLRCCCIARPPRRAALALLPLVPRMRTRP